MNYFWKYCSNKLESELTPQQYITWIKPLIPVYYNSKKNILKISAPNRFKLDLVKKQFSGRISDLANKFWKKLVNVEFILNSENKEENTFFSSNNIDINIDIKKKNNSNNLSKTDILSEKRNIKNIIIEKRFIGPQLLDDNISYSKRNFNSLNLKQDNTLSSKLLNTSNYKKILSNDSKLIYEKSNLNIMLTFNNFIIGKSNQLANLAASQIADNFANSYNPLFIYGGVGLGKTHLMHAIGNKLFSINKFKFKIRYIHAEKYVSDVVKAYQKKAFDNFKKYYHSLDLLLIDDIQFFSGKSRTQEEFFYAFEALVSHRSHVIITSDSYPKEISGIDDRLISRLNSGLTVAIDPPELEMRVEILIKKAQLEGVYLNENIACFLAKNITSNTRELEGALRKILAYSKFYKREISIELAEEALKDLFAMKNRKILVENIQKIVSDFYSIKISDMFSKKRPINIAKPRQIAMYLSKKLTKKSLPEIGNLFGGRDHTTVLHSVRKIINERNKDDYLNHELHLLEQILKG